MANTLFESGRQTILNGTVDWAHGLNGAGGIQAALMTYTAPTAGIKAVTGATVATPCVLTVTANGFSVGDIVLVSGVGGTLTANGIFQVIAQATNTITLGDYVNGNNVVGVGTYTSGGVAINLGAVSALGTWASFSGAIVGGSAVAGQNCVYLTGNTEANGIAEASATTFTAVSGAVCSAVALIACAAASGVPASTDQMLAWIDGQMIVTCAATAVTTTLPVERLPAVIPASTVLSFDDGTSATMSAAASTLFGRTLTTTGTATTTPGARATAPASGSGLPVTPNGGNISITWDTVGAQHVGIFKL
jgi:hypothetical protein